MIKEIKQAGEKSPVCGDLLGQLEQSYEEKMGHWKRGGIVVDKASGIVRLIMLDGQKIGFGKLLAEVGTGPYDVTFHRDKVVGRSEGPGRFLHLTMPDWIVQLPALTIGGISYAPGTYGDIAIVPVLDDRCDFILQNQDRFNFWIGKDAASITSSCGFWFPPERHFNYIFAEGAAVIHDDPDLRDCSMTHGFSSEAGNDNVFAHESGHMVFGLADQYCCDSFYWQPDPFPNLYTGFEEFFGGGSPSRRGSGKQRGSDLRYDLEISLEEVFNKF